MPALRAGTAKSTTRRRSPAFYLSVSNGIIPANATITVTGPGIGVNPNAWIWDAWPSSGFSAAQPTAVSAGDDVVTITFGAPLGAGTYTFGQPSRTGGAFAAVLAPKAPYSPNSDLIARMTVGPDGANPVPDPIVDIATPVTP